MTEVVDGPLDRLVLRRHAAFPPVVVRSAGQPTRRLDPAPSRGSSAGVDGPVAQDRATATLVASITVDGTPPSRPPSTTRPTPSPKRVGAPPRAVVGVGSPWRLALVAAIGPDARGDRPHQVVVGHPQPDGRAPARPGGARRPTAAGSTSVSGPGHHASATAATGRVDRRRPSASACSTSAHEHGERHARRTGPSARTAGGGAPRSTAGPPARRRCRSAGPPPRRPQQRPLVDASVASTTAADGWLGHGARTLSGRLDPWRLMPSGAGHRRARTTRHGVAGDQRSVAAGEVGLDATPVSRRPRPAPRGRALRLADLDHQHAVRARASRARRPRCCSIASRPVGPGTRASRGSQSATAAAADRRRRRRAG